MLSLAAMTPGSVCMDDVTEGSATGTSTHAFTRPMPQWSRFDAPWR